MTSLTKKQDLVTNMRGSLDYRVVYANSPREFRTIRSDNGRESFTIANKEVFDHLHSEYTLAHLDSLIPSRIGHWVFLGVMFDIEISLDHSGRFQFGKSPFEEVEDKKCEHGFVVRDIRGDDRFLCRVCDARFPRHPSLLEKVVEPKVEGITIANSLRMFREGMMTFTEAAKRTNLSLNAFKEAIENLFPPTANVAFYSNRIGSNQPIGRVTSVEPRRTSCPKKVEEYFANPDSSPIAPKSWGFPFDDVTEVSQYREITDQLVIYVEFVDGTKQKVTRLKPSLSSFLPPPPSPTFSGGCY